MNQENPTGLKGIAFVEWSSTPEFAMNEIFEAFGFSKLFKHNKHGVDAWKQNNILFLHNQDGGFAKTFRDAHGPSICGMGFWVEDAKVAFDNAVKLGARPFDGTENTWSAFDLPAIYGIGDSLVYFVDNPTAFFESNFVDHDAPVEVESRGFLEIDHLTNNVHQGTLGEWQTFYKDIFGFTEVRTFDIRGESTGLFSYALRSPDGSFCIPINEGTDEKSQIEEYLRDYNGPFSRSMVLTMA